MQHTQKSFKNNKFPKRIAIKPIVLKRRDTYAFIQIAYRGQLITRTTCSIQTTKGRIIDTSDP